MNGETTPSEPMTEFQRRWRKHYDIPPTAGTIAVQSAAASEAQPPAVSEQPVEAVDA